MKLALAVLFTVVCGLASAQFYGDYKDQAVPGQSRVAMNAAGVGVHVDQHLNEFVPMDAKFTDDQGKSVLLKDMFAGRPIVVLPCFFKCPGVCTAEINNLFDAFKGFKKDYIGRTFDVIVLSIDPRETSVLSATKKDMTIAAYMGASTEHGKRIDAEHGAHFLTGDLKNIRKLTDALGFVYKYDETNGDITHPAGIMVLTPSGKISRYFITNEYPQQVLLNSIRDAGSETVGVKDDRGSFIACMELSPLTGKQSVNILNILKVLGVLTIVSLVSAMWVWNRKYKAEQGGTH